MRWRNHTLADDAWLRAEELLCYPEEAAEYDAAASRPARTGCHPLRSPSPSPAPLLAQDCFRQAAAAELRDGKALIGALVRRRDSHWHAVRLPLAVYQWPLEGWVQGRVRCVCQRAGRLLVSDGLRGIVSA